MGPQYALAALGVIPCTILYMKEGMTHMKHTNTKRLLSWVLSVCMILTMFSGLSMTASAAGETWTKVELADVQANDKIVIVCTKDKSTFALPYSNGSAKAPAATPITVSGDAITSEVTAEVQWNVTGNSTDGYTFCPAGNTTEWLYCTSSNNGVRVGTNSNKTFVLDSASGYLKNTGTNRYLGVYLEQEWRCYTTSTQTNIANQTFAFYKLQEGGTPVEPDPYNLSVMCENGTVLYNGTAAAETQQVNAGEKVTLEAQANEGYELDTFTAERTDGTALETTLTGTTLTFTMPSAEVLVTATFKAAAPAYNITCGEVTELTAAGDLVTVSDAQITVDKTSAKEGETVTLGLEITGTARYNIYEWEVKAEGATEGEPVVDNQFIMPAANVTVTATVEAQKPYTVCFMDNATDGIWETEVYQGESIALPTELASYTSEKNGYTFVGWTYDESLANGYAEIDWSKYTADENNEVYVYAVYAKQTGSSEITISAIAKDGTRYYAAANTDDSKLTAVTDVSEALRFNKISKGKSEDGKDLYNFTYVDANGQTWYVEHGSSSKLSVTTTPAHESGAWKLDGAKLISVTDSGRALGLNTQTAPPTFRAYDPNGGTYPTDLIMEGGVSYSGYTTNPQPAAEVDLGSLSVIFNYDNDQELLISDLTGKSDSAVTKVEIAEDSTGAVTAIADTERVDLGLNQSLSEEVTLAFRVEYADGAIYTGNLVVTTGDKIYYDDANSIFNFSNNDTTMQGDWTPTDKAAITLTAKPGDATDYVEGFNSLTHHAGTVHKATVLALDAVTKPEDARWPSVTFDFCGTGFDLITEMNSNTGAVLVTVYDGEVNVVKNVLFDLYYGAKLENGEWIAQDNGSVYQIPSTISGLPWGQYTVEVSVRYSPVFDHLSKDDTYDFFFDGVRIHDPLNRAETNSFIYSSENILDSLKSEAGNTPVFIDGMDAATAADIETYGLKGEVLLANGQSVALRVTADLEADIEIGAHAVNGTAAEMTVFEVDDFSGTTTTSACKHPVASSTEMHYAVTGLTWEPSGSTSQTKVLVIRNTGAGILALTDVRTTGSGFGLAFNSATDVPAAIRFTRQLNENIDTFASLTDVVEGAWYYDSVKTVVEAGIMRGKGNGRFAPNDKLTRAEVVKVLHTLAGSPEVETTHSFTDVKAGSWYADAVAWGAANGIVKGVSETTFAPNATVTREQMVVFLHRFAGNDTVESDEISAFVDGASVSNFAVEAMNWAVANGIVSGMGHNDLAPKGTSTRAQMAKILASCESVIGK